MRLSWNEIRARAAEFAREWKDAHYEKGETQTFYNEFFNIFGVPRRRVASFEEPVKKLGDKRGFIDLFWKGVLLVEQKSAGQNLVKAKAQAYDYFPGLKDQELPRYILVSDFQNFELYDLDENTEHKFPLAQLPANIERFTFILGVEKRTFKDQDPVNIAASELMGRLHDVLKASGYPEHHLERLLVRLLFCLFADDTGIFEPRDIFLALIEERTQIDGSDVGQWLTHLFQVLNTPIERRQSSLDEDLAEFPYVNGDLFSQHLPIPSFNSAMRSLLIEACEFKWSAISPAIFGSLFQSVMNPVQRRKQGAHYTTEQNILKLIQPLFLDDLRNRFDRLKSNRGTRRRTALQEFHEQLGKLKFLDPACGCGNFLIIAYRELRLLEIEILKEIHPEGQRQLDVSALSRINVDQFFGIELDEFAVRIAETALWMMDHIMNNVLSLEFGQSYLRIPLATSPHIHDADALEIDWSNVLPPTECSYVLGNPPFGGSKYQSAKQREQVRTLARLGGSGGTLDFVTAWFLKAGAYIQGTAAKIGFVATNSITQGEQVAQLWPLLFDRHRLEISFAHRTFAWKSEARGEAHVHVVIIGLDLRGNEPAQKRLFSYVNLKGNPTESIHNALTAYLFDAGAVGNRHLVVKETSASLTTGVPKMVIGSKPIDDGNFIFADDAEKDAFLAIEPGARPFIRPYVGSKEYINGRHRWILYPENIPPAQLRRLPAVTKRIAEVRRFRQKSTSKPTQVLADTPASYHVTVVPAQPFLCIPKVSSELRDYVPIGWLEPPTIPSDLVFVLEGADLWHFGILTSRMHMSWLRHIGGRLKSDYRYSIGIVYNAFPWPNVTENDKSRIRTLAQAVLNARALFPDATLADLYDATVMKPELRRAHAALDLAVDRLYRIARFANDRERVEHLFGLYERLATPLTAAPPQARRRVRNSPAAGITASP